MIKNYTSDVPVSRTIARIEECLMKAGATGILKDFAGGRVSALCFKLNTPQTNGKEIAIRVPVNEEAIYKVLVASVRRPREGTLARLCDQASRTGWKLMQDWIEVQLSLIQMKQADALQVFLPYVWNGKMTFYQSLSESKFRMLTSGTEA